MKTPLSFLVTLCVTLFYTELLSQTITPTQTDALILDNGQPAEADPGDRIRYTVTITESGGTTPGNNVTMQVTPDVLTTFVPGSFRSSPLAIADAYACTGNVGIQVPAGSGLLINDFDDNIAGLTAAAVMNAATTMGGQITISADGSFTYIPLAGFNGADSYTYTLNDGNPVGGPVASTDMGVITFNVSNLIYFIDNSSVAATSDGRRNTPYKSLADFNSGSTNAADIIYIEHTGTNYTGGIVLANNERLFGEGHTGAANLSGVLNFTLAMHSLGLPAINGMRPVVTHSGGDGVILAMNNSLRGFDVGACMDFAIENNGMNSVGDLMISEVSINNSGGGGFDASNGSGFGMNVVFSSLSSSGGTNGINLVNCAGSFSVNGGTISNPSGTGAVVSGGSVVVSCFAAITDNSGLAVDIDNHDSGNVTFSGNFTSTGTGIRVQNCGGGTKTFSGTSKSLNTGVNQAVTLAANTGATINFTNGGLVISTTSGMGFSATGGGTVTVQGTGNTISSGTGTALNVANTTIGANNLTFQSISSNGGTATGIILDNTSASGGLIVNGDGSNTTVGGNSSGGTIAGKSGSDGSTTSGIGIYLNNTRNVVLRRMTVNGTNQNFGIRGSSVVNCTLDYCTIGGTNGTNDGADEGSVIFTELTGSATVTNCHISGAVEHNMSVINTSGLLNRITVTGSTFGTMNTSTGSDGLLLETLNTAVINSTITNNTFTFARGDHFQLAVNSSTNNDIVFTGNTITNTGVTAVSGGGGIRFIGGSNNATASTADDTNAGLTFNVSNNTMRDSDGSALAVNKLGGGGNFSGTISNNIIGVAGVDKSGSIAGSGIFVLCDGWNPSSYTANITGNTVRQYGNFGIYMQMGGSGIVGSANMHLNVSGNTVSNPSTFVFAKNGIQLNCGVSPGDSYFACLNLGTNSITGTGTDGGTDFRLRQRQSTTVRLPGYAGANNNDAAVITFVQSNISGAPSGSATNTVPTGGGFVGGAACNAP